MQKKRAFLFISKRKVSSTSQSYEIKLNGEYKKNKIYINLR